MAPPLPQPPQKMFVLAHGGGTKINSADTSDLEEFFQTASHDEILKKLESIDLGRCPRVPTAYTFSVFGRERMRLSIFIVFFPPADKVTKHGFTLTKHPTVFRSILENTTNGNRLVCRKLDQLVYITDQDENKPDSVIKVDLSSLMGPRVRSSTSMQKNNVVINHIVGGILHVMFPGEL